MMRIENSQPMFQSRNEILTKRADYDRKYKKAYSNILSIVIFTVINIFLLVTKSSSYFLFSAAVPRLLVETGMYFCGYFPEEYYGGSLSGQSFLPDAFLAIVFAIALFILGLYLLFWFMAKRKMSVGWLIAALVFFVIDTLIFFWWYGFSSDMVIDLLFRGWIGYSLLLGISAAFGFRKIPEDIPSTTSYSRMDVNDV